MDEAFLRRIPYKIEALDATEDAFRQLFEIMAPKLEIDYNAQEMRTADKTFAAGDEITLEGSTGRIFEGRLPTVDPELDDDFHRFMKWADDFRELKVRTNADTPDDAANARGFGAEGIGLCRTEHMFFEEDRILAMREMICAEDETGRRRALAKILPMQRSDFEQLFQTMSGLPVTIRLLDPPLHEFLPSGEQEIRR